MLGSHEEGFRTLVQSFHAPSCGEANTEAGCKENRRPDWVYLSDLTLGEFVMSRSFDPCIADAPGRAMTELCEWNPERDEPATEVKSTHQRWGCIRPAIWAVGSANKWHLCDYCAALPRFKRLRKRIPLDREPRGSGTEARAISEPVTLGNPITRREFARQVTYIAHDLTEWAGDCLGYQDPEQPMKKDALRRFLKNIRDRLDMIEQWERQE